ncbi:methyl-accepting chemotaxis protein [Salirhabdus sp. Marseille-P4669]|uniref:methyl-accepting chemotaxis protein n=1 Tax=Salirhabdus sp. Marseille-P4669 TaxID=2042310 RepID=UPI000C7C7BE7|nr:methyl-accepting chemotaxis protein [Salirhabdus sp. Marseille-P4669]
MKRERTLKRQFNLTLLLILVTITIVSGIIQYFIIDKQVEDNVKREATNIGHSIKQGIEETNLASRAIEQQIDYKLESISERIGDHLPKNQADITEEQLQELKEEMNVAGIDIFAEVENDIAVVKTTEPAELGFSMASLGEELYLQFQNFLHEKKVDAPTIYSYQSDDTFILYTAQSGSREEPEFFKYSYYHEKGTDYIISVFIEANEVYQFTQSVGPETWIQQVLQTNELAKEIAVLNPLVFKDPSLAEAMYPPLEKIVYGNYTYKVEDEVIIKMLEESKSVSRLDEHNGNKIYKMFIPINDGNVIYVAMDYEKMSAPFTTYSFILISFGFISLLVLFFMTTRFFNRIYENITKIKTQIKSLEKGDFTARSHVKNFGELGQLSVSANKMAQTLNDVLSQTREKAVQTERYAYMLESEADNSVDKVYVMSMEYTSETRESLDELLYLIEKLENYLQTINTDDSKAILAKVVDMRELVKVRSSVSTEMTITLADVLKSLHGQSAALTDIAKDLLESMETFNLDANEK